MCIERIGIMTGGGDCPGLNPVIRAAVKTGIHRHGFDFLGIEDAYMGLIDPEYRSPHGNLPLDEEKVDTILTQGGTILGTSNRADPFAFAVSRGEQTVEEDISDRVMRNFEKLGLQALISIGGDGSMKIAQRFVEKGLKVVGVPKTIDNDLSATDVTFGFNTAVQVATEALDRIRDTAESHDRVMLVEVMGRHAGWIALHAGLAGGAHAILIPEISYKLEPLAELITRRRETGHPFSVVVVAEGAKPAGGEARAHDKLPGAMPRLFGAAARVADDLSQLVDVDMRVTVLGHIQRGGSPSCFDRILGTRFGHVAAELVAKRQFGKMVALRGSDVVAVPIAEAVGKPNLVDPQGQQVEAARALGVVFGDE
jgi:6-phosphofructokinase 1